MTLEDVRSVVMCRASGLHKFMVLKQYFNV